MRKYKHISGKKKDLNLTFNNNRNLNVEFAYNRKSMQIKKGRVFHCWHFRVGKVLNPNQQSLLYLAMGVWPSSCQNFEMVPFHVMTSWHDMVGNSRSRWVITTRNGFEVLRFPFMQSSFSFTYVELLAVPATSLLNDPGQLSTGESVFVGRKDLIDVCFGKKTRIEGQSSRRIYWYKPSFVWWGTIIR